MLKIKNPNDIVGMNFVNHRYKLERVEVHNDRYRFEFRDDISRYVYVDLFRKPIWNSEENRNMYEICNGTGAQHKVSADWFGKLKNMQWTFTQALKDL
jgi:hypothetical protein